MIKTFGYFALFVFFVLCSQIGGFSGGFAIWFLSILLVASGVAAFACLQFPQELENGVYKRLLEFAQRDHHKLLGQIDEIATMIRKDGLLSVESARRDLSDPFLRYLLKRIVNGFEKTQIVSIIRNQLHRNQELFVLSQNFIDRLFQTVPMIGLIGTLFYLMDFLTNGKGSVGVSFIPFVLALLLQLLLQSFFQERVIRALDSSRLYFLILEETVQGIQDGVAPELLRDKLEARLSENMKWADR